jgi:hypothetical protein
MAAAIVATGQPVFSAWVVGSGSIATSVAVTGATVSSAWSVPSGHGILGLQFATGNPVTSTWVVGTGSVVRVDLYRFTDASLVSTGTGALDRFTDT